MDVDVMRGKTLVRVTNEENERLRFVADTGEHYVLYHSQDCCETVRIEEIIGDLEDLVGARLLMAEQVSSKGTPPPSPYSESYTWTFYKFGTMKGYVTVRWLGESNGYYSEGVDFVQMDENNVEMF